MTLLGVADLVSSIAAERVATTLAVSLAVTGPETPIGGVPATVAVLENPPASMSTCVVVYEALHVNEAVGDSVVPGHEIAPRPGNGSSTSMPVRVTLPVFVTRNE